MIWYNKFFSIAYATYSLNCIYSACILLHQGTFMEDPITLINMIESSDHMLVRQFELMERAADCSMSGIII
jgi:hypothetical protein